MELQQALQACTGLHRPFLQLWPKKKVFGQQSSLRKRQCILFNFPVKLPTRFIAKWFFPLQPHTWSFLLKPITLAFTRQDLTHIAMTLSFWALANQNQSPRLPRPCDPSTAFSIPACLFRSWPKVLQEKNILYPRFSTQCHMQWLRGGGDERMSERLFC